MKITKLRARWPEPETFSLFRPDVGAQTIFVHLLSPAELFVGGQWVKVTPGACFFSAPHSEQGIRACGGPISHDWFHAEGDISPVLRAFGLRCGEIYYPPDGGALTHDVEQAELEKLTDAPFADELCALRIESMIARLGQALSRGTPRESPYLYRAFTEVRKKILLSYDRPQRAEEIAAGLSLSPSRFYKLYRSYFGISPAKDVRITRIEHACRLLLQPDMTVERVSEQIGFSSVFLFIRAFRDETGQSPGAWRRSHLSGAGE